LFLFETKEEQSLLISKDNQLFFFAFAWDLPIHLSSLDCWRLLMQVVYWR